MNKNKNNGTDVLPERLHPAIRLYIIMFFYAAMDGWRDGWLDHEWLPRHLVKWIAYFSLPIYVLWKERELRLENWKRLLWLAAGGFFFWQTLYWITR